MYSNIFASNGFRFENKRFQMQIFHEKFLPLLLETISSYIILAQGQQ